MNELCETMNGFIIDYVNKNIKEEDKFKLLKHLNICPECRKELAFTLKLSKLVSQEVKEVPQEIMDNIFSIIPKGDEKKSNRILIMEPYANALELLNYAISISKKSVKFALQLI